MSVIDPIWIDEVVDRASSDVGLLWPLDRSVAVNPLVDRLGDGFSQAVEDFGSRLGVDPWPSPEHLEEAARRGLDVESADPGASDGRSRPPTALGRSHGVGGRVNERARAMVGQALLESVVSDDGNVTPLLIRAAAALRSGAGWTPGPRHVRQRAAELLDGHDLDELLGLLGSWTAEEAAEEMARHFARLPGWAAWAKWNDCWAREAHPARVTRQEFLAVSLSIDLAWLEQLESTEVGAPPKLKRNDGAAPGIERLEMLERAVHDEILDALTPGSSKARPRPRFQIVTCIDVRSEPLRRSLEASSEVETFGFAGFFGVFALVEPTGEREAYESLPVIAEPTVMMTGGQPPTAMADGRVAAGGTLAQLTHEPTAMFALAETAGFLGSPWLLARSALPKLRPLMDRSLGPWKLDAEDPADIAESALRGMGLTRDFAPEVVLLGHRSSTANNPHFATLECGACAGHTGGPNAAALAGLLNDSEVRATLRERGIEIPDVTRFTSGEHDTTLELVVLHGPGSPELLALLRDATDSVAVSKAGQKRGKVSGARRLLDRRARDWAELRPEWGLADHVAFVVAQRSSIRAVDLGGRCFLHSYDPDADDDGSILSSILAAPMVVAQWINATYYFSTVAPEVLGAGDKTLLNPVGDFAVIQGDDPDLRLGLPWQSVAAGDRPMHLPVRLLVMVEAPLERIAAAVRAVPAVELLVEGAWIKLVGRGGSTEPWIDWLPGSGWAPR